MVDKLRRAFPTIQNNALGLFRKIGLGHHDRQLQLDEADDDARSVIC
jgi:hypothetical protein